MNTRSFFFGTGLAFLLNLIPANSISDFSNEDLKVSSNNSIRRQVENRFKFSPMNLEQAIFEQYEEDKVSRDDFEEYFERRFGQNYGKILARFIDLKPKIDKLEELLFIPEFKFVLMSESQLNQNAISYTGARGISQLTTGGVKGIIGDLNRDSEVLNNFFDIDIINKLIKDKSFIFNPFEEVLPYDNYNFKRNLIGTKDYASYGSEWQITRVRLPRYILLSRLFDSGINYNLAFDDLDNNLKIGAAIYFSYKLELSFFSKSFNYVEKSPKILKNAYNRGITNIKSIILNNSKIKVINNPYAFMTKCDAKQAREHYDRFIIFKNWFNELDNLGIRFN